MDNNIDKRLEKLTNLSEGYKAYLYDCDGTLADNMEAHKQTYIEVAAQQGLTIDGAIIDELAGWPIRDVLTEINRRYNSHLDPDEFSRRKYELFHSSYINKTKPIPHVVDHLKAHAGKVKIAVVSGSSRPAVTKTLEILGLTYLVEAVVCAGETERGKPFADPFLKAAELLNVAPSDCLVFEDGNPGTQAAEAAGMKWVRIDKL
ncbi:MAG: HAD family phosphatase [Citrobacter freundii]|nr:MAG: HAD family phosphatase [Citrobacter freundii]